MKMDLHQVMICDVSYEGDVLIDSSYFGNTGILEMPPVHTKFSIYRNSNQEDILSLTAEGQFFISDSKTLEKVPYPFSFEIEEKIDENNEFFEKKLVNSKNTLDIIEILWENIVLEIPISYSLLEDVERVNEADGWEVTKEGDKKSEVDPRLAPLLGLLDKEKE